MALTFRGSLISQIAGFSRFVGTNFREFGFQTLPLGTNFRGSPMQVISVGTFIKILVNNLPNPLPLQAMLSFDDQTYIYTRKTIYLHLSTLYWEGGGDYAQIVPLKITIVVPNDSLVIFWTVFTGIPTTLDLHCLRVTM